MINLTYSNTLIGIAVIILNLIPFLTKKYNYLVITAIISLIIMYIGGIL
ncbi:MAG: hypothetical protein AABW81_04415 [Nanoarchaeota archaeon]